MQNNIFVEKGHAYYYVDVLRITPHVDAGVGAKHRNHAIIIGRILIKFNLEVSTDKTVRHGSA